MAWRVLWLAFALGVRCKRVAVTVDSHSPDGVGQEWLRRTSLRCFAWAHPREFEYVHTPFTTLEHGQDPHFWEGLLGEGCGARGARASNATLALDLPSAADLSRARQAVGPDTTVVLRTLSNCPLLVNASTLLACLERAPSCSPLAAPSALRCGPRLRVAVHIRRGDFMLLGSPVPNPVRLNRVVPMRHYEGVVRRILECAPGADVTVYSEGWRLQFRSLARLGARLVLNGAASEAFAGMAWSDVLVLGRSSFSFAAALLHSGAVVREARGTDPCAEDRQPRRWLDPQGWSCEAFWAATGCTPQYF